MEIQHHGLDSSSVAEHRSCSHQCNVTVPEGGSDVPAVTPPAQGVVSSCPGDSGTAQQGRSGDTSDCLPATGEERPLCSEAASQHAEFKFNFAIPEAGAGVNLTGESTADPAPSQQLENVESTASKSTRKKKKRNRTQNSKTQAGIRKDQEQPSQNSQGEERNSVGLVRRPGRIPGISNWEQTSWERHQLESTRSLTRQLRNRELHFYSNFHLPFTRAPILIQRRNRHLSPICPRLSELVSQKPACIWPILHG